jgi:hypothetical protein
MKNTFKKLVSLAILASILLTFNVNAAAIPDTTVALSGNNITVTGTGLLAADEVTSFKVTDQDGVDVTG